eukprot:SAG11_NODE_1085_length_5939_cov_9.908390_2_plen_162_part_00
MTRQNSLDMRSIKSFDSDDDSDSGDDSDRVRLSVSGAGAASAFGAGLGSASGAAWTPSSSWVYIDDDGNEQGPYTSETMKYWYESKEVPETLMVRNISDGSEFTEIKHLVTKGEFEAARNSLNSQVVKPRTRRKKMKTHPTAGQVEVNAFFGAFAFLVLCG